MSGYYLGAIVSFFLSLFLTGYFGRLSRERKLFIPPVKERDSHRDPTPRIGGLAIVLAFLLTILLFLVFWPQELLFTNSLILGVDKNLLGLLIATVILTFINLRDDFKSQPVAIRLGFQIAAALVIALFGIKIQWFSNPFGNQLILGSFDWLFVVIWLVVMANVVNWLDGFNGLAGGVSAIALAVLFFLSVDPIISQTENALLAAIGFGAVMGFLPWNLFSKVFMGDTGSVFLGFLIGVLAIISGGKVATAFLVLAIPFLDAIVVFFTRLLHGQSPFLADRRHLHHRLLSLGLKKWQIISLFYLISLGFGLIALNTQTLGKFWAIVLALGLMTIFVLLYSWGDRRRLKKTNGK